MARDETAESEPGPDSPDSEEPKLSLDSEAPAEHMVLEERVESLEDARREEPALVRTNRAAAGTPSAAALSRVTVEDCEAVRREAESSPAGRESADARYRLAVCSLMRHEREATAELEALAVKDAEAFLALESEGARADQVRTLLRRIKPD
jgi:hypothetical protein